MRVRVTCEWRSTLATQETPAPGSESSPPWGCVGAVADGRLVRLRPLNLGYAQVTALEDGLQVDHQLAVLRDDGSLVRTGPVISFALIPRHPSLIDVNTNDSRYRLELKGSHEHPTLRHAH